MATVKVIPQTINPLTKIKIGSTQKRRVAAYARVSTDRDERDIIEAQVATFKLQKDDRLMVKVYSDDGITGTNTKRKTGFEND